MNELKLFSGTANPELAIKIADKLGIELGDLTIRRFSDGEVHAKANQSVRGCDAFIVQSCQTPVNEHLMELLVIVDSFRRASVRRVTVVMPYFCYSRQDKKLKPREPVTAKLVANLLTTAGANRVLTMDLHAGQIMGFFDIPVDHLYSGPIIAEHIKNIIPLKNSVVVSPDVGGVVRARALAEVLGRPLAIIIKRRPEPNKAEVTELIGDVHGKTAIMFDDMIDTGGSIIGGAEALLKRGAADVYAACTHGVFSGNAVERLSASPIKKLIVTDTIPLPEGAGDTFSVVSVADILADAVQRIHSESSISEIFDKVWKAQS